MKGPASISVADKTAATISSMHCLPPYSESDDDGDVLSEAINSSLLAVNQTYDECGYYCPYYQHYQLVMSADIYPPPSPSSSVNSDGPVYHTDDDGELSRF